MATTAVAAFIFTNVDNDIKRFISSNERPIIFANFSSSLML
jgi:hypothetical protein